MIFTSCELGEGLVSFATLVTSVNRESHRPEGGPSVVGILFFVFFFLLNSFGTVVKNLPANTGDAGDTGSIPGSGRSLGEGHGNPLQCSCLENPMDRGVRGVTESDMTQFSSVQSLNRVPLFVTP